MTASPTPPRPAPLEQPVNRLKVVSTSLALAALLAASAPSAREDKPKPPVYAIDEKVEGKTQAEWSAEWWKWALAIPKAKNPILDKTGKFAGEGQTAAVFFLAGTAGGKATRECTVPAGKPIFFPVLNGVEYAPPDKADDKKLAAAVKEFMDRATDMKATLDGKSLGDVTKHRVASAPFAFVGPAKAEDAPFDGAAGKQRAASDGCWIMLKPLSPGEHVLKFEGKVKGEKKEDNLELAVTYKLKVVEKK
jgi:hypothetical protein